MANKQGTINRINKILNNYYDAIPNNDIEKENIDNMLKYYYSGNIALYIMETIEEENLPVNKVNILEVLNNCIYD